MGRRTNELEWGNALNKVLADDNYNFFFLEINIFFSEINIFFYQIFI